MKTKGNIIIIAGARPNFMKVAPLCHELKRLKMRYSLINTGQHFTAEMSGDLLKEFGVKSHYTINPPHTSAVAQFSVIVAELGKIFEKEKPSFVVVVGDVNSTLAGAIVANKMGIPLAHIEAGLRSFNRKMPEEINRIIVDQISDILFVTEENGMENLKNEKVNGKVYFVGNIMIDTLKMFLPEVKKTNEEFYFCTLHRAENVDDKERFNGILDALEVISRDSKIYLPLHPRTEKMAKKFGLTTRIKKIFSLLPPLSYKESLFYQKNAKLVLTDSGGVQEETSFLGTSCITLREETERPITVTHGTNIVAGVQKANILKVYAKCKLGKQKTSLPLWDGKAAKRIVRIIINFK